MNGNNYNSSLPMLAGAGQMGQMPDNGGVPQQYANRMGGAMQYQSQVSPSQYAVAAQTRPWNLPPNHPNM